ncbi:hypothetical protein EDD18DRAFT_1354512 [Armillaria luteobubalina]|uniref:Uncharacterized protein n=1 Tax=Armillaria luteobubalina TaxID=153913 RepID=A0AA39UW03_9AGAR|nr:hypothetical protein EDD18DRAFT_1354512 [Armillaria luteobubalina]
MEREKKQKAVEVADATGMQKEVTKDKGKEKVVETVVLTDLVSYALDEEEDEGTEVKEPVEDPQGSKGKAKAWEVLVTHCKDQHVWAAAVVGIKKKKVKSTLYAVDSDDTMGPSGHNNLGEPAMKRLKTDPVPGKGDMEFVGKECTEPQGSSADPAVMEEVLDLLHSLHARMDALENKLEVFGGQVGDLLDDYHPMVDVEYPTNFIPKASEEEWALSLHELHDLEGANPEALQQAMAMQLDKDITQVWHLHVANPDTLDGTDPFELANIELWVLGGKGEVLLKEYLVEDSDGEFKKELVRAEMVPGAGTARVPELDMIKRKDEDSKKLVKRVGEEEAEASEEEQSESGDEEEVEGEIEAEAMGEDDNIDMEEAVEPADA